MAAQFFLCCRFLWHQQGREGIVFLRSDANDVPMEATASNSTAVDAAGGGPAG